MQRFRRAVAFHSMEGAMLEILDWAPGVALILLEAAQVTVAMVATAPVTARLAEESRSALTPTNLPAASLLAAAQAHLMAGRERFTLCRTKDPRPLPR